jgi:plastocyanin
MMGRRLVRACIAIAAVVAALPAAAPAARHAQTVNVTLKEFRIVGVPAKLQPGAVTFNLTNSGKFPHNLMAIFGPTHFKSAMVQGGATGTVTGNLKPGAYIVVCGVGSGYHASQGMIARFTVGTFDFATGKWKA